MYSFKGNGTVVCDFTVGRLFSGLKCRQMWRWWFQSVFVSWKWTYSLFSHMSVWAVLCFN